MLVALPALAQDGAAARMAEAERARRELDRAAAEMRARAEAEQARMAREDSQRLAVEARRRADENDARQRALAAEYDRRRLQSQGQAYADKWQAELERRAAEQRAWAADEEAQRAADRQRDSSRATAVPSVVVPATPSYRYSKLPTPAKTARVRPARLNEGVVLCQPADGSQWRCTGPLRVAFGNLSAGLDAVATACGRGVPRNLGRVRGMRAFGCGFAVDPGSFEPGQRDVAAVFGVDVPGRLTYPVSQR